MEYVAPEMLIVIAALWVLGMFLKNTPSFPDWFIVWAILIAGIVAALFVVGFSVEGVIQGIIAAGVAVFVHQLIVQTKHQEGGQ
ncbi:holin [Gracilibacillus oryzae]|uniref:Holin n=2 Tax=Gracilibacillus oryzae TaxID=1672701 RepID=A0A7C8GVN5_9BACI|nr:holin [Gracilibacillus oryzae]